MGGDGGSIVGRADCIRVKGYGFKRNLGGMGYDPNTLVHVGDGKLSDDERRQLNFTRCRLTEEKLELPIVADRKGNIFTKENLIKALLDKTLPPELNHIKRLKDVKQIAPMLEAESSRKAAAFDVWDPDTERLQCPITGTTATGTHDFYVNWRCGCLFSKKARDSLPMSKQACPVCGKGKALDLVELVPRKNTTSDMEVEPSCKKLKITSD
eukprot:Blabericola_migrator_1__1598@NODE_1424_length_4568_cov_180_439014_g947_i0_p2_GENE_NODE_1424_length_4568_cov_180_439014_g947_i0NODE_1424_length_4568_cov_180_439014_g947_i0_p2_ORF_typecomplete_len211_score31_15Rtf2/PF04641_12/9_4e38zfNse/PF11789_8/21zfNse/PF11789_8/0_32zfNOSIP/PF15906_5/0_041zfNOSIP/PF15906_5/1_3e04Pellino/PF04710_14/0_046_NODE_1424_length_4568_cov_180_439014_g947_i0291923